MRPDVPSPRDGAGCVTIELGGKFLHIRYFALRDAGGAYRGVVEMAQDVSGIRALQGQRRLMDW